MIRTPLILICATLFSHVPATQEAELASPTISDDNIVARGAFQNARLRFEREKKGHVAFLGGSITEMNGYRPMVMGILEERFPETEFQFTAAGIASTCSTTGAFRLPEHVLNKGPVDLLFVEFAVNDDQDGFHPEREAARGMEGIVRRTRLHNPNADIVVTYFVNERMLANWQAKETPLAVKAHERVAQHYKISAIHLARQVAQSIDAEELTWKRFGGTHPKPFGNRMAAQMVDRLMELSWQGPGSSDFKAHHLPEPIDVGSYFGGRWLDLQKAELLGGAVIKTPDWKLLKGTCRPRFLKDKLCCLEVPGAKVRMRFSGTAIGAYVLAGPDAPILSVQIDNMPEKSIELLHVHSKNLHLPRTVMFDGDLSPGEHTMTVQVHISSPEGRQAARICSSLPTRLARRSLEYAF